MTKKAQAVALMAPHQFRVRYRGLRSGVPEEFQHPNVAISVTAPSPTFITSIGSGMHRQRLQERGFAPRLVSHGFGPLELFQCGTIILDPSFGTKTEVRPDAYPAMSMTIGPDAVFFPVEQLQRYGMFYDGLYSLKVLIGQQFWWLMGLGRSPQPDLFFRVRDKR